MTHPEAPPVDREQVSARSSTRVRPTVGIPELRTLAVGHLIMAAVAGLTRLVLWFRYFLTNTVEVEPRDTEEMLAVLAIAVHVALAAVFFRFDSTPAQLRGELPRTASRLVEQWRSEHVEELLANWRLAQKPASLTSIEPLR